MTCISNGKKKWNLKNQLYRYLITNIENGIISLSTGVWCLVTFFLCFYSINIPPFCRIIFKVHNSTIIKHTILVVTIRIRCFQYWSYSLYTSQFCTRHISQILIATKVLCMCELVKSHTVFQLALHFFSAVEACNISNIDSSLGFILLGVT